AARFEPGDEILVFAHILFHHVLHDRRNAVAIESELARRLDAVPNGVWIVISWHAAETGAAIRDDQRRDDDEWSGRTRPGKRSRGLQELAVGAFDHNDDRPLPGRRPTVRQRKIVLNRMRRGRLQ